MWNSGAPSIRIRLVSDSRNGVRRRDVAAHAYNQAGARRENESPTIIFDEIDTGVSGEIADKMGEMMVDMSRDMQVMAITHLPQVAAKGDSHFKVFKKDEETRTLTHVRRLDEEARVREIAAMMSGSEVGDAALNNARVLLGRKSGDKQE